MIDDATAPPRSGTGWLGAAASGVAAVSAGWLARALVDVDLPFLFCVAAVTANALHRGVRAGLIATALSLAGTILVADPGDPLVTMRSVALVSVFCIVVSVGGETMKRRRLRERQSAIDGGQREQFLQTLFDRSPAVILITDSLGHIVDANHAACALFERTRSAFIGEPLEHLVSTRASKPQTLHTIVLPSGKLLRLRATSAPIGTHHFRMIYVRDETDAVVFNERLAMAQRKLHQISRATALGQLASSIAHELDKPLAMIANHAGMARAVLATAPPDLAAAREAIHDTRA